MDLEDEGWVNVPYDGILEVHDDGEENFFSRKHVTTSKKLFKMDSLETSQKPQNFENDSRMLRQLIPLSIQMDHTDEVKEITKLPILSKDEAKATTPYPEPDQDSIFQVFFKKENEFAEIKMDSLRSYSQETNLKSDDQVMGGSSPSKVTKEEEVVVWSESEKRLNFWKWGLSGIGAFCSLGMAAATICIIILGNGKRHSQQNQKLRIQFSDNKRIKQVVHQANEAMSAVRGVPLAKAHITYGGHYDYEAL